MKYPEEKSDLFTLIDINAVDLNSLLQSFVDDFEMKSPINLPDYVFLVPVPINPI